MNNTKDVRNKKKTRHPQQRLTVIADAHLERIYRAYHKMGRPVTKTSLLCELILSTPIPNGVYPVSAAEVKKINEEAKP